MDDELNLKISFKHWSNSFLLYLFQIQLVSSCARRNLVYPIFHCSFDSACAPLSCQYQCLIRIYLCSIQVFQNPLLFHIYFYLLALGTFNYFNMECSNLLLIYFRITFYLTICPIEWSDKRIYFSCHHNFFNRQ